MELIPLAKLEKGDELYVALYKKGDYENPPQTRIVAYAKCTVCATFYDEALGKKCLVVKKPNDFYCSKVFPTFSRDYTVVTFTDETCNTKEYGYNKKPNEPVNYLVMFTTNAKQIIESAKEAIKGMKADKIDEELKIDGATKRLNQFIENIES